MSDTNFPLIAAAQVIVRNERWGYFDPTEFSRASALLIVSKLTWPQQIFLVDHATGPRPYNVSEKATVNALILRGLLRFDRRKTHHATEATEEGRGAIAFILSEWADILARTGGVRAEGVAPPPHRTATG